MSIPALTHKHLLILKLVFRKGKNKIDFAYLSDNGLYGFALDGTWEKRKWFSTSNLQVRAKHHAFWAVYWSQQESQVGLSHLTQHFALFQEPGKLWAAPIYDSPSHSFLLRPRERLPGCAISSCALRVMQLKTSRTGIICVLSFAGEEYRCLKFPQETLLKICICTSLKEGQQTT